ncbi:hypothetical protein TRFO_02787 [Tritrichomonas foetus]|uniref:Uncharacterized protein n=1 Tax=Tritrichomonas foetus TaxID=1144522 RepID=A0A1J4KW67_9EUKA|nr:hypothetical protein TRFO_02787 [Tritrichomonas foetus]|eukprot:OHT15483.1 hypothetical protein TRFO_02787 [Tritrichomonas foetus]
MSRTITIKIPLSDFENGNSGINAALESLKSVKESVNKLRDSNLDTERVRDQYIIHLQQCQEDHSILRQIYKNLKLKIDQSSLQCKNDDPPNLERYDQNQGQIQGQNNSVAPSVKPKAIPTIEFIHQEYKVEALSENSTTFFRNVRPRHQIRMSTVIKTLVYSTDGSKIAFADDDYVFLLQTEDGEIISQINLQSIPNIRPNNNRKCLKFSPDDKLLAVGNGPSLCLYNIQNIHKIELVRTFTEHTDAITAITFKYDGSWAISGGDDGYIVVHDLSNNHSTKSPPILKLAHEVPAFKVASIANPLDSSFYTVGFRGGMVGIYNDMFDQPMVSFPAHHSLITDLTVSSLDDSIATASSDGSSKIWLMRGVATCKQTLQGHSNVVTAVSFSPSINVLFSAGDDGLIIAWQQKTGAPLYKITGHTGSVLQVAHHPNLPAFASCGSDGLICLWEYEK